MQSVTWSYAVTRARADKSGRAAVAATHEALRLSPMESSSLFPHAGKDFNEKLIKLHA